MNDDIILPDIFMYGNELKAKNILVVFARAPVPGTVKTRLAKQLGDEKAARLYAAMLRDSMALARRAACGQNDCEVILCFTPDDAFQDGEYSLAPFWRGEKISQGEGGLGEKLLNCFAHFINAGAERVVIIGSDSPDLPASRILYAFDLLTEKTLRFSDGEWETVQRQLVLGPSRDGGFYLIGASDMIPMALFEGVSLSTRHALKQVLSNAESLQLYRASSGLKKWGDVDTPGDLQRLIKRLKGDAQHPPTRASHTAHWLRLENLL